MINETKGANYSTDNLSKRFEELGRVARPTEDFNEILEEARKAAVDWMSTSDTLAKEPVYSSNDQFHNDHDLEQVRNLARQVMHKKGIGRMERVFHEPGLTGKAARYLGVGVMWLALNRWSHVFLKRSNQRLVDAQKWLSLCLQFESALKRFSGWLSRVYPSCSLKERIKAIRMLWTATFLAALYGRFENINDTSLFACALLYPLVDDYLDTETNDLYRQDFAAKLKSKVTFSKPSGSDWSSPHPNSKLVGELVEQVMQRFMLSSSNRQLAISLLYSLIDLELKKVPKDLLFSTTCKGGFTLCLLHMMIVDSIDMHNIQVLLRLGLSLQMVDDLQDIHEDLGEMTNTLATDHVYSSPDLRRQFARTINFIRYRIFTGLYRRHKIPFEDGLKIVFTESLVLLCMEAAVNTLSLLSPDIASLTQHCQLSSAFLKKHPIELSLHRVTSLIVASSDH
ncbi:hypothetical protein PSACC_00644 [Paramicrosporidium saccamoebae]|uniref:Uncharacterized protein n=1 Tax=Paramicrosporidium saccamoebae TaxID=1246581 RepID=A0A2H9TP54_9FUNG|nr:hypothetical protein PSACC_00644 [Paramicrosporidium saccamoebae]